MSVVVHAGDLTRALGVAPLTFRHGFDPTDPRFALPALTRFARSLPPGWARALVAASGSLDEASPSPLTPADAVAGLTSNGHTVRLYHLELHPAWQDQVAEILRGALGTLASPEARPTQVSAALFLASPGAITPWHPDRHHNLLFQIRGHKCVTIGRFNDPDEAQRQLERTFVRFGTGPSEVPPVRETYRLGPGDGLYIPPCAMHTTVVTGGDVSVALSCGWSTRATEQAALVHTFNTAWRRHTGRAARPPGQRRLTDRLKAQLMRARLERVGTRRR